MIQIKAIPLFAMWCISFSVMALTGSQIQELDTTAGIIFWVSFAVFCFSCIHATKNKERLDLEIDELFGKQ